MTNKRSTLHEIAIQALRSRDPLLRCGDLGRFAKELWLAEGEGHEGWRRLGFTPDAWKADVAGAALTIYEVEDRHPLNTAKMRLIVNFMMAMDAIGWTVGLITADRWGNQTADVNLWEWHGNYVRQTSPRYRKLLESGAMLDLPQS